MILLVLAGGMAAGSTASLVSRSQAKPPALVETVLGSTTLAIPSPLLRAVVGADPATRRVDLAMTWPTLGPTGVATSPQPSATLGDVMLVSVSPRDDGPGPELRATLVYGRFLDPGVTTLTDGLVLREFKAGTPYAGENLFLSAPDGRRFAARCEMPGHFADALPNLCVAEFRRGPLDIRVRFEPGLLSQWEAIEQRIPELVAGMVR